MFRQVTKWFKAFSLNTNRHDDDDEEMMAEPRQYTLADFNACIDRGFQYNLPNDIIGNIIKLKSQLGLVTANGGAKQRPVQVQSRYGNGQRSKQPFRREPSPTKEIVIQVKQEKEGLEKDLSEIRIALNKISEKNYQNQLVKLVQIIRGYAAGEGSEQAMTELVSAVYSTASSNSFLAGIYARLYSDLIEEFEQFGEFLMDLVNRYEYTYVVVEDPYEQNKVNDAAKARMKFYAHLMLLDVIEAGKIMDILRGLFDLVEQWRVDREKEPWLVEVADLIAVCVTVGQEPLKGLEDDWDWLYGVISEYGEMRSCATAPKEPERAMGAEGSLSAAEYPALSGCVLFKFREMMDAL
jgi:hypothetical protein